MERQVRGKQFLVSDLCSSNYFPGNSSSFKCRKESSTALKSLALVSLGGVAGTLSRFGLGQLFPNDRAGTLAANIIGVALASALLVLMERRGVTELRLLLLPGFCAGLTTFSAVTAQSLEPRDGGMSFLLQNVVFSLVVVIIILPLARKVIPVRS